MSSKKKIGILGASGYTGADAVRLLARHPNAEITALTANTHAGKAMGDVFPHFFMLDLPKLVEWEKVDWSKLDAVFCGLPHGTTQEIIAAVLKANPGIKVLDMSADFRLRDKDTYAQWYGHEHRAPELQGEAVYGLTEFYREKIASARLVACPGCYPTAVLLALVPLAKARLIDVDDIVIDAKSGVTGAGRGLKQNTLFSEAGEGLSPYSVGTHRHAPEIEQEIGVAAGTRGDGQLHAASDPDERAANSARPTSSSTARRRTICGPRWRRPTPTNPSCMSRRRACCRRRRMCAARTMFRSALSPTASRTGRS